MNLLEQILNIKGASEFGVEVVIVLVKKIFTLFKKKGNNTSAQVNQTINNTTVINIFLPNENCKSSTIDKDSDNKSP